MTEHALRQAASLLNAAPSWTLFTHRNPDGDALGSVSALLEAGRVRGKRMAWFGPDASLPPAYAAFLPHVGFYRPCQGAFPFDQPEELYVFLDCANEARSVEGFPAKAEGIRVLNIDHHEDNSRFGTVNCVDPGSSSTAELLFRVLKAGEWPLPLPLAEGLYLGIWTDSGGFSFSNTTPRTHRLAAELLELGVDPARLADRATQTRTPQGMALWGLALSRVRVFGSGGVFALSWLSRQDFAASGALDSDTEGLPNFLMSLREVRLAALLTEREGGEVRASFRSREGIFGAADVARALGGGGHPRAAGAAFPGPLAARVPEVVHLLECRYAEWTSAH